VSPTTPQRIWFVQPDPSGRANVFLVTGPGFAGFCDTGTGEFVTPPIGSSATRLARNQTAPVPC